MHSPKVLFLFALIVSLACTTPSFPETTLQQNARLKKEAQDLTQQSKNSFAYTSILMKGSPALRVDVDASLPLNRETEKGNTEWAAELFSMGFKRYVIVQGDSYWVFTAGERGFDGDIVGKTSDLPAADNALAKRNVAAAGALKAEWPNVLKKFINPPTEVPLKEDQRQEEIQARIKRGPPAGATIYRGMYIGEPMAGISHGPNSCVQGIQAVLDAILNQHRHDACMFVSDNGEWLDKIVDFVTGPEGGNYNSLVARFGSPLQGRYAMSGFGDAPEWNMWKRRDGTWIASKRGHASYMSQGDVFFTEVVVFKR
jgi:hypothetical protein